MLLTAMQWFCHCVQVQIDSVGVFVWALAPFLGCVVFFLLFASLFPLAKRKSGWGICGSSLSVWLWFSFCCFNRFADSKDSLSLYRVLSAYSHVRTEPLARHRPHSRKKKVGRLAPLRGLPLPCFHTKCVPIPPGLFVLGCQFVVGP